MPAPPLSRRHRGMPASWAMPRQRSPSSACARSVGRQRPLRAWRARGTRWTPARPTTPTACGARSVPPLPQTGSRSRPQRGSRPGFRRGLRGSPRARLPIAPWRWRRKPSPRLCASGFGPWPLYQLADRPLQDGPRLLAILALPLGVETSLAQLVAEGCGVGLVERPCPSRRVPAGGRR